ncbi:MAG: DNA cytosine methyltransferase [Kiritimatiellia bacterium]
MRVVDLFAGAGGFSTGARLAGANVVWAGNHWPLAVKYHAANHPAAIHACQDLHQANWSQVPGMDLLLASPACQGHSRARGRAGRETPAQDESRSTAWAVVSCAEYHRPKTVIVENVAEFLTWALYPAWKTAMQALGYRLTENVLNAADFGVPQSRVRLFIVARLGGELTIANPELEHVAASTIIDWNAGNWNAIARPGRSASTLAQVCEGRKRFGKRFLVAYYGREKGGRDLAKPLGTVTTRERFALVDGKHMRMLGIEEIRQAMGFPAGYILPSSKKAAVHLLGNAVVPEVAKQIIQQVKAAG